MRIVSQDGKEDMPYDAIALSLFDTGVIKALFNARMSATLGEYPTEERAKEVMQQIRLAWTSERVYSRTREQAYIQNKVFYMPKE